MAEKNTLKTYDINQYEVQKTNKVLKVLIYIGLVIWALIDLFPIYWMFTFSLKNNEEVYGANVMGLPKNWLWSNYEKALTTGNMPQYFLNSVIVTVAAIAISLIAALMATYALTRIVWKGREMMNAFFMLGITIPIHSSIVPIFITLSKLKVINSYWSLIIPYSAFSLAMAILICTGFMNDIPKDLDEAAYIDGCTLWQTFIKIIVPLMKPALATISIYTFPSVLERIDVCKCIHQQKSSEDTSCRYPGLVRSAYHGLGTHRRSAGDRHLPHSDRLHLYEQIHSGELHRRSGKGLTPKQLPKADGNKRRTKIRNYHPLNESKRRAGRRACPLRVAGNILRQGQYEVHYGEHTKARAVFAALRGAY